MKKSIFFLAAVLVLTVTCKTPKIQELPEIYSYNNDTTGTQISIEFTKGKEFNHPLFAFWIEDEKSNFVQTLYVSQSIGKGVFEHGNTGSGVWMPGPIMRPAALPRWSHQRGIVNSNGLYLPDEKNPIADAYTGATPKGDFVLNTIIEGNNLRKFNVYMEINQTWDWNEYWTNSKYPEDAEYKTSCQPALIYLAEIDLDSTVKTYELKAIGHSHYSGKTGEIFTDLSTITTALEITKSIQVIIK